MDSLGKVKAGKHTNPNEIKKFMETSLLILDKKSTKVHPLAYSMLSKAFNYWKIQEVL